MSFIGVLTESKNESEFEKRVRENLKTLKPKPTILTINDKTIGNIKNIKFDMIVMNYNRVFKNQIMLKKILQNTKKLILNTDIEIQQDLLQNLRITVITYGFNSKSTVTASSINEDEILLCIQRSIQCMNGEMVEPQEIKIDKQLDKNNNPYLLMAARIISLLYEGKCD